MIALLAVAAFALGGSADVVVYNGRSQYGDEQAFKAFEEQTGLDVELRGGTAPELFERLRREGDETPADLLVTTDLANLWRAEEAGLLEPVETAGADRQRRRAPPRPRRRVVGNQHPDPYADALDRAGARRRRHELRGPRRSALSRQAVPAHEQQRVQPVASSPTASPSTAKPRHGAAAAFVDGEPAPGPRFRRGRARRDRRGPLRRRPDEPLLPGAQAGGGPGFPRRPRVARSGWRRRAHQPVRRRPRQGQRAPRSRGPLDGVLDRS